MIDSNSGILFLLRFNGNILGCAEGIVGFFSSFNGSLIECFDTGLLLSVLYEAEAEAVAGSDLVFDLESSRRKTRNEKYILISSNTTKRFMRI